MANDLTKTLINFIKNALHEIGRIERMNKKIRVHNKSVKERMKESRTKKEKKSLEKQLKDEKKVDTKKVAIILNGPPGIGKTTGVHAVASTLDIPVIETNASDSRTASHIKTLLSPASRYTDITSFFSGSVTKKRIIFVDEVDGLSGSSDRGGVSELVKVIHDTSYPIVLAANEWKKKLKPLYAICEEYDVPRPSTTAIKKNLEIIADREGLDVTSKDLSAIARSANGDFRGAISDLQSMSISKRDQLDSLWDVVRGYFSANNPSEASKTFRSTTTESQNTYRWIFENVTPRIMPGRDVDACASISMADMVLGHIHEIEEWSMYPQFIHILECATSFLRNSNDRLQKPRYYRDYAAGLEDTMNVGMVSRIESSMLNDLLDALYKKDKKEYKKRKINFKRFVSMILSQKF